MLVYILMAAILFARPAGLFGRARLMADDDRDRSADACIPALAPRLKAAAGALRCSSRWCRLSLMAADDPFLILIGTRILAYAIAAMALDLILGYGAMVVLRARRLSRLRRLCGGDPRRATASTDIFGCRCSVAVAVSALFALVTGRDLAADAGRLLHHDHARLRADGVFLLHLALGLWRRRRLRRSAQRSTVLGSAVLENDVALYYVVARRAVALFALCARASSARASAGC